MLRFVTILAIAIAGLTRALANMSTQDGWSKEERETLKSLALSSLEPLPTDPSNRFADDTLAARFGQTLFFDARLSANGKVSCATCHLPGRDFQDDVSLAQGIGTTSRRTMPIAGTAYSPWMFWDGRSDSQWSQALGPLESHVEHGGDRTQYVQYIAATYRKEYERLFGSLPDVSQLPAHAGPNGASDVTSAWEALPAARRDSITRVYANMGKAIAAFERRIALTPTRFDRYVAVELAGSPHTPADSLTRDERAGLNLFIGKANCVNCHNGARLTDDHFHNTGVPVSPLVASPDSGRIVGVRQAMTNEFNCLGRYSDAGPEQCAELRFAVTEGRELVRAFKTPSLRNVADHAPYMHAGQLVTLSAVIDHYSQAPKAPFGHSELKRVRLSKTERTQIEAFLRTLSSPAAVSADMSRRTHSAQAASISFGPIVSHAGLLRGTVIESSRRDVGSNQYLVVRLEAVDGQPVASARIVGRVMMPELEAPAETARVREIGRGLYEIAGFRYARAGWWNVDLVVSFGAHSDSLAFNAIIQ